MSSEGHIQQSTRSEERAPTAAEAVPEAEPAQAIVGPAQAGAVKGGQLGHRTAQRQQQATLLQLQRTQGNLAVARLLAQRQDEGPAAAAAEPATAATEPASGLIVDDAVEELGPGQMRKGAFLAQMRSSVEAELSGADFITATVARSRIQEMDATYSGQDSATLETTIKQQVPETAGAASAQEYIAVMTSRLRASLGQQSTAPVTGDTASLGGRFGGARRIIDQLRRALFASNAGDGHEGSAAHGGDRALARSPRSVGQPLAGRTRAGMESVFGQDFSHVRVHTDADAGEIARQLDARAVTVGSDITFGAGEYQPGTPVGDALIAHELAHVTQQHGAGEASPAAMAKLVDGATQDGALEEEADRSAAGAVAALWGGAKGNLAEIGRNAMPRLRSGLRLSRCPRGGSAGPAPHPSAIATTTAGTLLNYGAVYTHTFSSSTGSIADIAGVMVGERVTVARDDFGIGWGGVPLGTITARINAAGRMNDQIGTPAGIVDPLAPSLTALPGVFDTPQTLHWQDASGAWHQFASVGITLTVNRNATGGLEAVTVDNGVPVTEPFTGALRPGL